MSIVLKNDLVGFVDMNSWESKKNWKPYLLVNYKTDFGVKMLYITDPSDESIAYFDALEFGDTFELKTSV